VKKLIDCGWRVGRRTACPVLVDNLPEGEVDHIWAEISRINWVHREEELQQALQSSVQRSSPSCGRKMSESKRATRIRLKAL
jgi:hypothetical protein